MGYDAEQDFKAQKALTSIHNAREQADAAMDSLLQAHASNADSDDFSDAHTDLHIAVISLYNRLRPFLSHVPEIAKQEPLMYERDDKGQIKTKVVESDDGKKEIPEGIFGLYSLDRWRLATTVVRERDEKLGKPDEERNTERPIKMPLELCVAAYDALEEALVNLGFSAEPGSDVPNTHLDDAPNPGELDQEGVRTDGGGSDE